MQRCIEPDVFTCFKLLFLLLTLPSQNQHPHLLSLFLLSYLVGIKSNFCRQSQLGKITFPRIQGLLVKIIDSLKYISQTPCINIDVTLVCVLCVRVSDNSSEKQTLSKAVHGLSDPWLARCVAHLSAVSNSLKLLARQLGQAKVTLLSEKSGNIISAAPWREDLYFVAGLKYFRLALYKFGPGTRLCYMYDFWIQSIEGLEGASKTITHVNSI